MTGTAKSLGRGEAERFAAIISTQRDVAAAAAAALDHDAVMSLIVERTRELTRAAGAVVELIEGDEMVYRAASGTAAPHLGLRLKAAQSLSGRCVRDGEILVCDDSETDDRVDREACRRVGVRSMIVVPLNHCGQAVGVLKILSDDPRAFDDRDVHILELLAGLLGAAMANAAESQTRRELLAERAEALDALKENRRVLEREREFLRAVLEHVEDGIVACDADGRLTVFNRAARQFHGIAEEPLPPDQWARRYDLRDPRGGAPLATEQIPLFRALRGEVVRDAEMAIVPESGPARRLLASGRPITGPGGESLGAVVAMHDVTDRDRAAAELRRQVDLSERLIDSSVDGILAFDRDCRYTVWNPAMERITGVCRDDVLGRVAFDVFPFLVETGEDEAFFATLEGRSVVSGDRPFVIPETDRAGYFDGRYASLRDETGAIVGGLSIVRDTTERVQADRERAQLAAARAARAEAQAAERRWRSVAEAIPQMVWSARADGFVDYCNGRWADYMGRTNAPPDGWGGVVHPDDLGRMDDLWSRALDRGEDAGDEVRFRRADGSHRWHLVRVVTMRDASGAAERWLGTAVDIDDRRRAEHDLRASEARFQAFTDHLPAVAFIKDEEGRYVWGNPVWARQHVGEGVDPLGRTDADLWPEETALSFRASDVAALTSGGSVEVIETGTAKDGSVIHWRTQKFPLGDTSGRPLVGGVAVDVTADKQAEAALRQARDAAEAASRAKDQFLAVLSHELRTPLTPVLVSVTALLDDPDVPASVRPTLEVTRRNVELEARIIDDLLDVTRIAQGKLRLNRAVVDAHELALRAGEICRDEIAAAGLRLDLDLSTAEHFIDADPARVQQIAWNLIKNAAKFTPSGGSITIRSGNPSRGRLSLTVSDTGIGIAPDALPKIFDAFEQGDPTVTQQFGGLGLGLAISRSLAAAHGGSLTASSPGRDRGATFTLELPAVSTPAPAEAGPPPRESLVKPPSPLRLLLVEDNPDTLRVMARLLRQRGHEVSTAATVAGALEAARGTALDLVVSDVGLPDGSGLDLMSKLRERAEVKGIALSGYGSEDDVRRSLAAGFVAHLTKPVNFQDLEEAIRKAAEATS